MIEEIKPKATISIGVSVGDQKGTSIPSGKPKEEKVIGKGKEADKKPEERQEEKESEVSNKPKTLDEILGRR